MTQFFKSADGSTRCRFCALHPDTCTCDPANTMREILAEVGWGKLRNPNPSMLRDEFARSVTATGHCPIKSTGE